MSNIGAVIGWKHNHQEGMTCRENSDGVLEIVEFPGGIPSAEDQAAWTAEYEAIYTPERANALEAIIALESQETPTRLAEAQPDDAGGSSDGRAWLKANRDKIVVERNKL